MLPRPKVVERVTAATGFLRTESDELHRKASRLLADHRSELEHDGDSRRVVFCPRRNRHSVEVCRDHDVWLAVIEVFRFGDHIDRGPAAYGCAPGVSCGHPYLGSPHVVAQPLASPFHKRGRLGEVARGCFTRADLRSQMTDVAECRARIHRGPRSWGRRGSLGSGWFWRRGGRAWGGGW